MFKKYFPIFEKQPDLVYFDSAATALKPQSLLDSINNYYQNISANVHRGLYKNSELATEFYDKSREYLKDFFLSNFDYSYTYNASYALNILAHIFLKNLDKSKKIVITEIEHNSNLLPFIEFAKLYNIEVLVVPYSNNFEQSILDSLDETISLLSMTAMSNVLGNKIAIKKIIDKCRSLGVKTVIDASQLAMHLDLSDISDCDAFVFSAHKVYGPTGLGILAVNQNSTPDIEPVFFGGGMVLDVSLDSSDYVGGPQALEPGTPNIAGAIAFSDTLRFLDKLGKEKLIQYEDDLAQYLYTKMSELSFIEPISDLSRPATIFSFNIKGVHAHDVSYALSLKNICVRAGKHCTNLLHEKSLMLSSGVRVSLGIYNTKQEIDFLCSELLNVYKEFNRKL
jgi:cysteine desulfurase/selenocysteine lyase